MYVWTFEDKVSKRVREYAKSHDLIGLEVREDQTEPTEEQLESLTGFEDFIQEFVEDAVNALNDDDLWELADDERELFTEAPDDGGEYFSSPADIVRQNLLNRLKRFGEDELEELQNEVPSKSAR